MSQHNKSDKNKTVVYSVRLPPETYIKIAKLAEKESVKKMDIIRKAIKDFLAKNSRRKF